MSREGGEPSSKTAKDALASMTEFERIGHDAWVRSISSRFNGQGASVPTNPKREPSSVVLFPQPALQLIYDTAPIGLAFLSPDCRYLQINQRLTEICGISVEGHLGHTVRDCVPALADAVEDIVRSIMETGKPVTGIEVTGQRADQTEERFWITYWHPPAAVSSHRCRLARSGRTRQLSKNYAVGLEI